MIDEKTASEIGLAVLALAGIGFAVLAACYGLFRLGKWIVSLF